MSTSTPTRPTRPAVPNQRVPALRVPALRVPAQRRPSSSARPAGAAARPAAQSAGKAPVRLTRRGRIVVTLLLLGLVLGAFVFFSGQSVATGDAGAPVPTRTVVVGEGDTLWDIAAGVAAPGEVREMVHEIERLNSLPGPVLQVGQEIAVPVGG